MLEVIDYLERATGMLAQGGAGAGNAAAGGGAAVLDGMHAQLHLPGMLVAQDDRFVEEDIAHLRRCPDRGDGHCRVRGAGNDDGAIDDVIGKPRLRLDGPPAGVDGVAGGEILCAAEDPGRGGAVDPDVGGLGPEATALERIGGQFDRVVWPVVQRSELGSVPGNIGRGERLCHLVPSVGALAQGNDGTRSGR